MKITIETEPDQYPDFMRVTISVDKESTTYFEMSQRAALVRGIKFLCGKLGIKWLWLR